MYEYSAEVINIVDGDTIDLNIDLGFHIWVKKRARLSNIDTPERFTEEGKKSTKFVREIVPTGTKVLVKTYLDRTDKYGRVIAEIYKLGETKSLNNMLLENSLAKEYKK